MTVVRQGPRNQAIMAPGTCAGDTSHRGGLFDEAVTRPHQTSPDLTRPPRARTAKRTAEFTAEFTASLQQLGRHALGDPSLTTREQTDSNLYRTDCVAVLSVGPNHLDSQ